MSYSFSIRAETKPEAKAATKAALDELATGNDDATKRKTIETMLKSFIDALDDDEAHDIRVDVIDNIERIIDPKERERDPETGEQIPLADGEEIPMLLTGMSLNIGAYLTAKGEG